MYLVKQSNLLAIVCNYGASYNYLYKFYNKIMKIFSNIHQNYNKPLL